jgi:hypothetical protein
MFRPLAVCAAVLLIAVGCSSTVSLLNRGSGGRQLPAEGSVNEVTALLQARLADAGFAVITQSDESQVRLVGKTPTSA